MPFGQPFSDSPTESNHPSPLAIGSFKEPYDGDHLGLDNESQSYEGRATSRRSVSSPGPDQSQPRPLTPVVDPVRRTELRGKTQVNTGRRPPRGGRGTYPSPVESSVLPSRSPPFRGTDRLRPHSRGRGTTPFGKSGLRAGGTATHT